MTNKCIYAEGTKIYDLNDNEFLLKGVGLGGWMLPEGYMWGNHKYFERPRRFEARIEALIGSEKAAIFWDKYYNTFISDKDFELIKSSGYNHIRLPLNFRLLMEENELDNTVVFKEVGFQMIDYVLEKCREQELFVVLDLHGAPGGQTGANIDDSKYDKPELFTKRIYQEQTITLWEEIARRYKDESIVAMYDLLNEPLPKHNEDLFGELIPLYKEIIAAIRTIDPDHMISIEGVNWSTDFSVLNERLDENMIIHFHKYWNSPSIETIQQFLDKRETLNQPLYMGEGGENDPYWYAAAFKMYDQLDISWNFWTYKKIQNSNSIISFKKPEGWLSLFNVDEMVSSETAERLLNEFLDAVSFDNCTINHNVTNHLFRRDAFMSPSGFYDYHGKDVSFSTSNPKGTTIRGNDKTNIVTKEGTPYEHYFGRLKPEEKNQEKYPYLSMKQGDWYQYTFYLTEMGKMNTLVITDNGALFDVYINDQKMVGEKSLEFSKYEFIGKKEKNVIRISCLTEGIIKQLRLN